METLEERLQAAWAALSKAAQLPDPNFWAAFDEIEAQTVDGLTGQERQRATQELHAYLAELKSDCGAPRRR